MTTDASRATSRRTLPDRTTSGPPSPVTGPDRTPVPEDHDGDLRPLVAFASAALPTGWVLLSIPLLVDVPLAPFILGTLYLGLVLPAVLLTRREPGGSVRALLRDALRLPRPMWLVLPATLLIPAGTAVVGALLGVATPLSGSFLVGLAVANVLSSLLVVNLWEELAWAGFVQRRSMTRWGYAGGSVVTALLFTGIHLPLSLYDADGAGDVARNVAIMVVAAIGLRLLIGAFDCWGRGSILALGLLHATFNASSELIDVDADWIRYAVTLTLGLGVLGLSVVTGSPAHRRSSAATAARGPRRGTR